MITIHVVGVSPDSAAPPPDRTTIIAALRALQPLHRDLIRRAHFGGCTTHEIAADLGMPEPVVKCELHCALRIMHRLVATGSDADQR